MTACGVIMAILDQLTLEASPSLTVTISATHIAQAMDIGMQEAVDMIGAFLDEIEDEVIHHLPQIIFSAVCRAEFERQVQISNRRNTFKVVV